MRIHGTNIGAAEVVSPSDSDDLGKVSIHGAAQFLYVGGSGDVVLTSGGEDLTFTGLAAGMWHAFPPFVKVKSSGTTATGIIAGY